MRSSTRNIHREGESTRNIHILGECFVWSSRASAYAAVPVMLLESSSSSGIFHVRDRLITRRSRERQAAQVVERDAGGSRANEETASSEAAYVRSATHVAQEYWDRYDAAQVNPTTKPPQRDARGHYGHCAYAIYLLSFQSMLHCNQDILQPGNTIPWQFEANSADVTRARVPHRGGPRALRVQPRRRGWPEARKSRGKTGVNMECHD